MYSYDAQCDWFGCNSIQTDPLTTADGSLEAMLEALALQFPKAFAQAQAVARHDVYHQIPWKWAQRLIWSVLCWESAWYDGSTAAWVLLAASGSALLLQSVSSNASVELVLSCPRPAWALIKLSDAHWKHWTNMIKVCGFAGCSWYDGITHSMTITTNVRWNF